MSANYMWRVTFYILNANGRRIAGPNSVDVIAAPRTWTVNSQTLGSMTENAPPAAATVATVITNNNLASPPAGGSIDVEKIVSASTLLAYS